MNKLNILFCAVLLSMLAMSNCQPSSTPTPTINPFPTRPIDPVTLNIFFIGSSHVYYSRAAVNLPKIFSWMAESGGHTVNVDYASEPGVRLEDHLANPDTLAKIKSTKWDYVVLQESHWTAQDKSEREEHMMPAVRALDQMIKENGAQTILYMTWPIPGALYMGNELGDEYFDAQAQMAEGNLEVAQEIDALVAPAGLAFESALQQKPGISLWYGGDNSGHASGMGQYLTAAVFYALIYQESPEGLEFVYQPEETARLMQSIAAETVLADNKDN